jgi:homoserine kinase
MTHTNDIGIVAVGLGSVAAAIVTAFMILPWVLS